ncbi:MAG: 4-(cytidine 5'-diphospho)-2-C-methyl-D-erythritol kinase, partial [Bacillota bacterium]
EVSTAEVYDDFSLQEVKNHPQLEQLIKGLKQNNYKFILNNLDNLLELVTLNRYPKVKEVKEVVAEKTDKALMSGSGPTILGFVKSSLQAEQLAIELKEKLGLGYKVFAVNSVNSGIELI